jgi:transcription initiation factor TFIIB
MSALTQLADRLHLPRSVKEEAAVLYRRVLDKGLVRGRSIANIATATLYAACRLTQTPRSLQTVIQASERPRKEIARCYRLILRELNLSIPIDTPMKYVAKIGSTLNLHQRIQNRAIQLLQAARRTGSITGKGPCGVAAAALYLGALLEGEKVTQKKLANAAGVTEVTVRNRYQGLAESLKLDRPTGGT